MTSSSVLSLFRARLFVLGMGAASLISCTPPGQAGDAAAKPQTFSNFVTGSVWFFLLGLTVYYILVLKPGFEEEDRQKKFIDELKKNDEVVTAGGIFGRVFGITPEFISIEIAPNVRIKVAPNKVLPVRGPKPGTPRPESPKGDPGVSVK